MKLFNFFKKKEDPCDLDCILDMTKVELNPYHKKRILELLDKLYTNYASGSTAYNTYMTPNKQKLVYKLQNCTIMEKDLVVAFETLMFDLGIRGKIAIITNTEELQSLNNKFN
jgi:hypothetical protein